MPTYRAATCRLSCGCRACCWARSSTRFRWATALPACCVASGGQRRLARACSARARPVLIREIEIIEIDETNALDAAYELDRMLSRGEWPQRFHWSAALLETARRPPHGYRRGSSGSTWQRLMVQQDEFWRPELLADRLAARVEATQGADRRREPARLHRPCQRRRAAPGDAFRAHRSRARRRALTRCCCRTSSRAGCPTSTTPCWWSTTRPRAYPWELLSPPRRERGGRRNAATDCRRRGLGAPAPHRRVRQLPQRARPASTR